MKDITTSALGNIPKLLFTGIEKQFDQDHAGFKQGDKFPNTTALDFLLNYFYYYRDPAALRHLRFTISTLLKSGMYDQIGGGVMAYSTADRTWRIPVFEKTTYDNALLIQLLAKAYRLIGRRKYKIAMEQTIGFMERELRSPEGLFYFGLGGVNDTEEGHFYSWKKSEIEAILGDEAEIFCKYYDISVQGNRQGTNIPNQQFDRFQMAEVRGEDREAFFQRMNSARQKVLAARMQRKPPPRDESLLPARNAMMVSAYVQAFRATADTRYRRTGEDLLIALLHHFFRAEDPSTLSAERKTDSLLLPDYAYLIRALLDVFELSQSYALLEQTKALCQRVDRLFLPPGAVLYHFAQVEPANRSLDFLETNDKEMPSGNAVMVRNLQDLAALTGKVFYRERASALLQEIVEKMLSAPLSYAAWAGAWLAELHGVMEVGVVGGKSMEWKQELLAAYLPFSLILASRAGDERIPILADKVEAGGTHIFLRTGQQSEKRIENPGEFINMYCQRPDLSRNT